ncbi:BORG1 protein, partial [Podargus strigoides]|nr:BORG1 protein [Podargus strigoides]
MATKAPVYLKRGSRKGKKEKLRDLLSSDMISPPLGDFRHTIHVGSGGERDAFGDISFLRGKFHLLPRTATEPGTPTTTMALGTPIATPFEFSRTATISGCPQPPETPSPLLKTALSLPVLGGPLPPAPPKPPRLHRDERAPAANREEEEEEEEERRGGGEATFLSHAGSLLSLHVDLGPSMLEDVLEVMERHGAAAGPE